MMYTIAKKAVKLGYSVEVQSAELEALLSKNRKKAEGAAKPAPAPSSEVVTPEVVDTSIVPQA